MAQTLLETSAPQKIVTDKSRLKPAIGSDLVFQEADAATNRNCWFESDRVLKSGYVQKRTQKTKTWKPIFIVLRHQTLSIYKDAKETKLRHQVHLADLTAIAYLKDPKQKRDNLFGLFSPSKNFHLQAPSQQDAKEWVELLRKNAPFEDVEEEVLLASPIAQRGDPMLGRQNTLLHDERVLSSSPEQYEVSSPQPGFMSFGGRRKSSYLESSGLSGNELASHSDFSDNDAQRIPGASIESLTIHAPAGAVQPPAKQDRTLSQASASANAEQDLDRVIWQGWLWFLRSKGGMRQWKHMWAVLRPRNMIMYKDESEYTAQWILALPAVIDVVDIDPLSKHKTHCLQVITEEKRYRFCAHDEEALVQCIGAFKSLLAKRRGLEARAAAAAPAS
jgi:hypothetical protein